MDFVGVLAFILELSNRLRRRPVAKLSGAVKLLLRIYRKLNYDQQKSNTPGLR